MKSKIKSTYLILGTALMLCSCAQQDEMLPPASVESRGGERIIFSTSLPGLESRAQIFTEENIPYFHVTAFNPADPALIAGGALKEHFANELIDIGEGKEGKYSSDNCIWPAAGMEGNTVTFFAYSPSLKDGAQLVNSSTVEGGEPNFDYKIQGFRVHPDITEQVDFVTAYTTGTMAENLFSGINLPFCHQLSRIEVKAWSDNKSCDIEIAGVRIGGIGVEGTFAFKADATTGKLEVEKGGGEWENNSIQRGVVEYIYRDGDQIVSLRKGAPETATSAGAVSIMGSKNGDDENCAMLIPYDYNVGWDFAGDPHNNGNNTFISVLLRITDATDTSGIDPTEPQRFPYKDDSQGANSLNVRNIPVVYLAVDKDTGVVNKRLYKNGDNYYTADTPTDATLHTLSADEEVKEFGWATLPVTGNWAPGNIYTYTLNYTSGIGLHGPEIKEDSTNPNATPKAGDPIISDKVGVSCSVKEWNDGGGSDCIVPGS